MTEIDLQISEEHDMSDEDRWQELITKIRNGEFDIIIMSPPCSTWSRAVWANRLGPKPVRSREFPFGFPWLKGDLKEKAELGTLLVMRCIETLEIAPAKTVCLWEHPEDLGRSRNGTPASVWQLEALRAVAKKRGMESIVFINAPMERTILSPPGSSAKQMVCYSWDSVAGRFLVRTSTTWDHCHGPAAMPTELS
jgi:hypothetical protein